MLAIHSSYTEIEPAQAQRILDRVAGQNINLLRVRLFNGVFPYLRDLEIGLNGPTSDRIHALRELQHRVEHSQNPLELVAIHRKIKNTVFDCFRSLSPVQRRRVTAQLGRTSLGEPVKTVELLELSLSSFHTNLGVNKIKTLIFEEYDEPAFELIGRFIGTFSLEQTQKIIESFLARGCLDSVIRLSLMLTTVPGKEDAFTSYINHATTVLEASDRYDEARTLIQRAELGLDLWTSTAP